MSAFTEWLEQRDASRVLLADLVVDSGGSEVTRRIANKVFQTGDTDTPANEIYIPVLRGEPFVERVMTEAFRGRSFPTFGGFEIARAPDYVDLDAWFSDTPKRMTLRLGAPEWTISQFGAVNSFELEDWEIQPDGSIRLPVRDLWAKIEAHENPNIITEGPNEGKPVPEAAGLVRMYQPDLENETDHIYRLADDVVDIVEVRKRNGTTTTAYSTSSTYLDRGRLKMNSKQDGPIYVTFKCGKDSGGNFLTTPAEIAEYLLTREAPVYQSEIQAATSGTVTLDSRRSDTDDTYNGDAWEVVTGSAKGETGTFSDYDAGTGVATLTGTFTVTPAVGDIIEIARAHRVGPLESNDIKSGTVAAFDTVAPYTCGVMVAPRGRGLARALDELIGESCGGHYGENRNGELELGIVEDPSGSPILNITDADIVKNTLTIRPDRALAWRARGLYRRYYSTLGEDLDSSVSESDGDDLRKERRTVSPLVDHSIREQYGSRAKSLTLETLLDESADMETELARRWAIRKAAHNRYEFVTRTGPFQIALGQLINLTHRRYGLSGGKDLIVVGIKDFYTKNRVRVTAWGLA